MNTTGRLFAVALLIGACFTSYIVVKKMLLPIAGESVHKQLWAYEILAIGTVIVGVIWHEVLNPIANFLGQVFSNDESKAGNAESRKYYHHYSAKPVFMIFAAIALSVLIYGLSVQFIPAETTTDSTLNKSINESADQ